MVGTLLLFQVDWGNPLTTGLVVMLFALAATGAAMVMGSVLHNASQAGAMGVFLGLVLAAIGGCMVPLEVFPPLMYRIAHLLPHAWAIEALTDSMATGAGPAEVATKLAVLALYSDAARGGHGAAAANDHPAEQTIRRRVQRRFPCLRHPALLIRPQGSYCVDRGCLRTARGERDPSMNFAKLFLNCTRVRHEVHWVQGIGMADREPPSLTILG